MNEQTENQITEIDWKSVRRMFIIGFCAAVVVMVGNIMIGWGAARGSSVGLEIIFSKYLGISGEITFFAAALGLIGMPIECICFMGIYKIIAVAAPEQANIYRLGVVGMAVFGACGVHVPFCSAVYLYNEIYAIEREVAFWESPKYSALFILPAFVLFLASMVTVSFIQSRVIAKELTGFPKWCWVFTPGVGIFILVIFTILPDSVPLFNALANCWISIGNMLTFGGLYLMSKTAERNQ